MLWSHVVHRASHYGTTINKGLVSSRGLSSYSFLQESLRWRTRLASETKSDAVLVSLSESEWDSFVQKISSASTREWFVNQTGVVRVPDVLLPCVARHLQLASSTKTVMLFRQDPEPKASEGGLLPPSNQWSALAKVKSVNAHRVQISENVEDAVLSFLLSCYSYHRYQTTTTNTPLLQLAFPDSETRHDTEALIGAIYWAQDLISTPANSLTPGALQCAAEDWAASVSNVEVETVVGESLLSFNGALTTNYGCGMIHAVGRAAAQEPDREPRLIQLRYRPVPAAAAAAGTTPLRHIALVGKGVTYDTGGLNLKPGDSMLTMKKDMGGAALALGLMRVLVERQFPMPIDCWIPAVENVVNGNSYRPGDILTSVNGKTTEIGNTDAEGRLILADTLALASATRPDIIMDFATLTGAQRVALGFEIPAVWTNCPELIPEIMEASRVERDPIWQLPLWEGYRNRVKSNIADYRNVPSDGGMGGAIIAALYLSEFVDDEIPWLHVDFNGFDNATGLGRAQSLRTMSHFLWDRYGRN